MFDHNSLNVGIAATALASLLVLLPVSVSAARDEISRPPERREFRSPTGRWTFTVRTLDGWATPRAEAELTQSGRPAVRIAIPHRLGPCRAFVNDSGHIVILDEWFRAAGDHAATVLDAQGKTLARHSFNDVARVAGVPSSQLVTTARVGTWMSAEPALAADGKSVTVQAAGRNLTLSLETGVLALSR